MESEYNTDITSSQPIIATFQTLPAVALARLITFGSGESEMPN